MIVYILFNLGVLLTIYGTVLYSPSLVPDAEDMRPENAKLEIINLTKGALIAQNFEINQYNIGFDMMNFGGIFLIIGLLFYNNVAMSSPGYKKDISKFRIYKMRKNGHLQGNILEWSCLILFLFSFFTFLYNIFIYIIMISFIVGVIGFTIRKLHMDDLLSHIH